MTEPEQRDEAPEPPPAKRGPSVGQRITDELRRNSVAFVSLFIAVTGLLYNTWRNETSEYQRNVRDAGFAAIEHLADFQSVVNDIVYSDGCREHRNIQAWGHIKALETLAGVLPEAALTEISELGFRWRAHHTEMCPCSEVTIRKRVLAATDSKESEDSKESDMNLVAIERLVSGELRQCNDAISQRREQIDQDIIFPQVEKATAAVVALVRDLD